MLEAVMIGVGVFIVIRGCALLFHPMMSMDEFLEAATPENCDNGGREKILRDLGLPGELP